METLEELMKTNKVICLPKDHQFLVQFANLMQEMDDKDVECSCGYAEDSENSMIESTETAIYIPLVLDDMYEDPQEDEEFKEKVKTLFDKIQKAGRCLN